jgi:outer membrane protein assembly factor BamB
MTRWERYQLAFRCAVVCGVFAAVVASLLLLDYGRRVAEDPLNAPEYLQLKQQLRDDPRNEALQAEFRALDERLREAYFHRRHFAAWGTWLLLAGAAGSAALGKWAATLRRRLPHPEPVDSQDDPEETTNRTGRWAVAVLAGVAAIAAVALYAGFHSELPSDSQQLAAWIAGQQSSGQTAVLGTPTLPDDAAGTVTPLTVTEPDVPAVPTSADHPGAADLPELPAGFPSDEELRVNWPRFRGWEGSGTCPGTGVDAMECGNRRRNPLEDRGSVAGQQFASRVGRPHLLDRR